jgi:predicted TIM-barrel enzyme
VPAIADEAHRRGLTVTGHVPSGMDARQFVAAGADQINHWTSLLGALRSPGVDGRPGRVDLAAEPAARPSACSPSAAR